MDPALLAKIARMPLNCWLGKVSEGRGALSAAGQLPLRAQTGLAGDSLFWAAADRMQASREAHSFGKLLIARFLNIIDLGVPRR
jgi:hypothetical protein